MNIPNWLIISTIIVLCIIKLACPHKEYFEGQTLYVKFKTTDGKYYLGICENCPNIKQECTSLCLIDIDSNNESIDPNNEKIVFEIQIAEGFTIQHKQSKTNVYLCSDCSNTNQKIACLLDQTVPTNRFIMAAREETRNVYLIAQDAEKELWVLQKCDDSPGCVLLCAQNLKDVKQETTNLEFNIEEV